MIHATIRISRFLIMVMAVGAVLLCLDQACHARASKAFYSVQVGSFKSFANARAHAADVGKKEQRPCFFEKADISGKGVWYRVYLGKFTHPNDARSYRELLKTRNVINYGTIRKFEADSIQPAGSDVTALKIPKAGPNERVRAGGSGSEKITTPQKESSLSEKQELSPVAGTADLSDGAGQGQGGKRPSMDVDELVNIFWYDAEIVTFRVGMIAQSRADNQVSCGICRRYGNTCSDDTYPADYDEAAWLNSGSGRSVTASESARVTPQQWFEILGDAWQEAETDEKARTHESPAGSHLLESVLVKLGFTAWSFVNE